MTFRKSKKTCEAPCDRLYLYSSSPSAVEQYSASSDPITNNKWAFFLLLFFLYCCIALVSKSV